MERVYGLVGRRLGHSFSADWFAEMFRREGISDTSYRNFPIENIGLLPGLLTQNPGLRGFNVTIPYKESIIPLLAGLAPEAQAVGAVNCVKVEGDGRLIGYNTDIYGFAAALERLIGEATPPALILGTGGAAKAAAHVLRERGIDYRIVSRTPSGDQAGYGDVTPATLAERLLIVNATPLGTYPDTEDFPPIPYTALTPRHMLFDMVYNPPQTRFLALGAERRAQTMNGLLMLEAQAERSWDIWQS